ncbi:MAG: T9SS type A sorting domain-containing protein [Ignavibacteria bacterium]|nr:T9SS type A sorting domain-containing protein [Ignavibacteria bacterium]
MTNIFKVLSGIILFSGSLFSQWYNVSPPGNDSSLFCIEVVTGNVVYAGKGSHGIMVKTTNGGANWSEVNTPSPFMVNQISFLNETTGFIATATGLYKTNNGGSNWSTLITGGFLDLFFVSESTGFAISGDFPAKIYRTTNGGANFSIFNMGSYPAYYGQALCYVNPAEIFVLTFKPSVDSAIVFKCTNWDSGWVPVLKTKPACYDISFADANTGIVTGNFGSFRRTTDGGTTWQSLSPAGTTTIQACIMNSLLTGYFVCGNGAIYKTSNAGVNWFTQSSGTTFLLNDIDVLSNDNIGFTAGENGTILKTTNGGITSLLPSTGIIPDASYLEQNYPNPFNPETKIRFALNLAGNVSLEIFDISGRKAAGLFSGSLAAGSYEFSFNAEALAGGVYFYRLQAGAFTQVKKMILIK